MNKKNSIQDVIVPLNGLELHGILAIPKNAIGIVIFTHGHGSSRLSPRNTFVAKKLQSAGMATLLIDLLTPFEDETSGNSFDIELISVRLVRITQWVRNYHDSRNFPIAYFGASTGAAAAIKAAVKEKVVAIVSRGGRPDLVINALKRVEAPTLFIVGGNDEPVLQRNRKAFQKLSCKKSFQVVAGASHLFQEAGKLEEVALMASNWFSKWIKEIEHVQE